MNYIKISWIKWDISLPTRYFRSEMFSLLCLELSIKQSKNGHSVELIIRCI